MISLFVGLIRSTWFHPAEFNDRRLQACVTVVFCMGLIVWCLVHEPSVISSRVIDWCFITIMAVIGVYHLARGVDDAIGQSFAKPTPVVAPVVVVTPEPTK